MNVNMILNINKHKEDHTIAKFLTLIAFTCTNHTTSIQFGWDSEMKEPWGKSERERENYWE